MQICYAIFAGISLRLCSISLRSFRITFAAYLPTHIKSLRDFFQSLLNNHRDNLYIISIPFALADAMHYVCHNRRGRHHDVGTCLWHVSNALIFCLQRNMPKACPYAMALSFWDPSKKSFYHQGFFAVKRRAVFILGAKWIALVRGWRRDCVVGGMDSRFQ